jgi:hypothetical protein
MTLVAPARQKESPRGLTNGGPDMKHEDN